METIGPRYRSAVRIACASAVPVLVLLVDGLKGSSGVLHRSQDAAIRGPATSILCQPTTGTSSWSLGGAPFGDVLDSADASLIHYIRVTT